MSTLTRKAWGDLTQHRARTLLTAFTLCIAIASLGFLAVPSLLNAAMDRQVQQSHLYDVAVPTRILNLTPAQLSALGRLPASPQSAPTWATSPRRHPRPAPRTCRSQAATWRPPR